MKAVMRKIMEMSKKKKKTFFLLADEFIKILKIM